MKIRKNTNLAIIIALAFQTPIKEIGIKSIKKINDELCIDILRTLPINKMKMINRLYNINVASNTLQYRMIIDKDKNISIKLNEMDRLKLYYLFDASIGYENKVDIYNNQMTNNIQMYKDIIFEILDDNDEEATNTYVFYFIANDNSYLGFANDDLYNKHCIKSYDFKEPENAYKLKGNETDAKVVCIRRNYNSNYYGNWNYAKSGTDFTLLKY